MEKVFPRGGNKQHKKIHVTKNDDLFKIRQNPINFKAKKKSNKKPKRYHEETTDDDLIIIEPLSFKTLTTEMIVLGCIEAVREYELKVIFPGGSTGTVSIANVNSHYSNILKKYTDDPKNMEDVVITLPGMFTVGQIVLCKIISTRYDPEMMKTEIKLSLDPKDINGSLTASCLFNGMILQAAVASIEDHGYIIDVGIEGITSFLKYSNATAFMKNQGGHLVVGQLINCCIDIPNLSKGENIERQILTLSIKNSIVDHTKVPENVNITLHSLRPGMNISATVIDIQDNGLIVSYLDYKGCVYKDHLKTIWCKPNSYKIGQQVEGTVLYLHPVSKLIYMNLHFNVSPQKIKNMFGDCKIGALIEAKVIEVDKLTGVYFSLDDKVKALCTKKNLSDDDIENIGEEFLIGSIHKCRIIGMNHIDKLLKVATKRSIVEKSYLPFEDLQVGAVYKAVIHKLVENGMIVKLAHNIKGFVRNIDMSEVCLSKPGKIFHPGSEVKCRILQIDDSKDPPSVLLTCKKMLVNSKLPILTKYEDAHPGLVVEGSIVLVKKSGLLVLFFNGVKGWISSREFSTEIIDYPEKVFHIGQVIKCCVLSCFPEQQTLKLSLKIAGKIPFGLKDMTEGNLFEVGKIMNVKVSNISNTGLDVIILSHNIPAFLPMNHLADDPFNCTHLFSTYEIDEVINEVVCFSTRGVLIVSKKNSFLKMAKSNNVVKNFSDFQIGMIIPAVVKNIASFGMFLETFNNIVGLVPLKMMLNEKIEQPCDAGYVIHQSVMAKVIHLDKEKERITLSTQLKDCYFGEVDPSLDLLVSHLEDWKKIKDYYERQTGLKKKLAKLEVGKLADITITQITDKGVLCKVYNDLPGLIIKEHLGVQNLKIGQDCEGLILFVDLVNDCVELSLDWHLIKGFKKSYDKESSKPRLKQIIKCEAILIKKFFILVALKGHAIGSLAYLPSRRHLNDLCGRNNYYSIREFYHAVIKRIKGDTNFGILKQHDSDIHSKLKEKKSKNKKLLKINPDVNMHHINNDSCIEHPKGKKRSLHPEEIEINKIGKAKRKKLNEKLDNKIRENIEENEEHQENTKICFENKQKLNAICEKKLDEIKIEKTELEIEPELCNEIEDDKILQDILENENECNLEIGKRYKAIIKSVKLFQMNILVDNKVSGRIHITEIANNIPEGINPLQSFKPNQELEVIFLGFRICKMNNYLPISHTNVILRAECSLKSVRPDPFSIGQSITVFVKEFAKSYIKVWLSPKEIGKIHLLNLSKLIKVLKKPSNNYQICQALRATIYKITEDHIELQKIGIKTLNEGTPVIGQVLSIRPDLGAFVRLPLGYCGTIALTDFEDNFKPISSIMSLLMKQCFIRCQILSIDHETKQCILSTRPSRLQKVSSENISDREIEKISDVSVGDYLHGYLVGFHREGIYVEIGRKVKGIIPKSNVSSDFNYSKIQNPLGSVLRVQILSIEDKKIVLDLLDSDSHEKTNFSQLVNEVNSFEQLVDKTELSRLELPEGFIWNVDSPSVTANVNNESESDTEENFLNKNKGKKTEKEEEEYLYKRERQLMDNDREPTTVDDFDRLVLASPNSSLIWLKYMTFHLQQAEIEKAKAVGLRALKTISFRDEQEKLNVWVALLNLEILYGTTDSLKEIFDRALQYNEPIKIYNHMVNLYVSSKKYEEAEDLYKTMVRKFKHDKNVHINFGLFFMKQNKIDAARNVLQRSLNSLEKKDHIDIIAKFAHMEFKYGDAERGKTMFESILSNYKKRTDLWSVYIDVMINHSTTDAVRNLFERVTSLKLSPRKMKFFFQRYLQFEKQYGNESTVEAVQRKVVEYVETQCTNL